MNDVATLADYIEKHLRQLLLETEDGVVEIQRNELADQFNCVPSQINYVLDTRFTMEKGYVIESRRGGGGYVRIVKLVPSSKTDLLELMSENVGEMIDQERALHVIERLREEDVVSDREAGLMNRAVRRQVIGVGLPLRDQIRARLLKAMICALMHPESDNSGNSGDNRGEQDDGRQQ